MRTAFATIDEYIRSFPAPTRKILNGLRAVMRKAAPHAPKAFARKLEQYRTGKGTLQFPIDQPIPLELVRQIVERRVEENSAKSRR
jgi:uncharacterized protein YdhG (YjbR/CyaY superfamily)